MIGLFLVPLLAATAACALALVLGWGMATAFAIYALTGAGALLAIAVLRASCPERESALLNDDQ